jgi:hypothetical protein
LVPVAKNHFLQQSGIDYYWKGNFSLRNPFKTNVRHLIQLAMEHFSRKFFWYAGIISVLASGFKVARVNLMFLSWLR